MLATSLSLLEAMNERLATLPGLPDDDLQSIQQAISITSEYIASLKSKLASTSFDSPADEIRFFKKIKIQFDGRLIFYLILLRLQSKQELVSTTDRYNVYSKELQSAEDFHTLHYSFWQYWQMDFSHLDEQYFLRSSKNNLPLLDEEQVYIDQKNNAPMSVAIAKLYAYQLLKEHIAKIREQPFSHFSETIKTKGLAWTSTKAALIELIYALHEYGAYNKGQVEIKKIADYFSQVFQVRFANIYKTYEDIRLRKKSPTPFLDALKSALERRIERDNENAM